MRVPAPKGIKARTKVVPLKNRLNILPRRSLYYLMDLKKNGPSNPRVQPQGSKVEPHDKVSILTVLNRDYHRGHSNPE